MTVVIDEELKEIIATLQHLTEIQRAMVLGKLYSLKTLQTRTNTVKYDITEQIIQPSCVPPSAGTLCS